MKTLFFIVGGKSFGNLKKIQALLQIGGILCSQIAFP
jgi:hypothetical protein